MGIHRMIKPGAIKTQPGLSLDIALTTRCLLRCRYCTVAKDSTRELGADDWQKIIAAIAQRREIQSISLEGGEPLMRSDLGPIVESALHHAREVKVVTSGVIPYQIPAPLVRNPRFSFEVSLDGPPTIHNFLRCGSYDAAWDFMMNCIRRRIRIRFRTVISRHNFSFYETWLGATDLSVEGAEGKIGFFFDTLIAPQSLLDTGGFANRAALRNYPVMGLIPSPIEIRTLFHSVQEHPFRNLDFIQEEPLRGCQAAECISLSFDPAGAYSHCCESPNGFGSILEHTPETCLGLMEKFRQDSPCRTCPYFADRICLGCWTGQKCGMVGHWGFASCRELYSYMAQGMGPLRPSNNFFLSSSPVTEI
jgi:hypothetical protein